MVYSWCPCGKKITTKNHKADTQRSTKIISEGLTKRHSTHPCYLAGDKCQNFDDFSITRKDLMRIGAFLAFFAPLSAIFATLKLVDLQSNAKNAESSAKNAKGFRVISAVIEPHSRRLLNNFNFIPIIGYRAWPQGGQMFIENQVLTYDPVGVERKTPDVL